MGMFILCYLILNYVTCIFMFKGLKIKRIQSSEDVFSLLNSVGSFRDWRLLKLDWMQFIPWDVWEPWSVSSEAEGYGLKVTCLSVWKEVELQWLILIDDITRSRINLEKKTVGISVKDFLGVSGQSYSTDQCHRQNRKEKLAEYQLWCSLHPGCGCSVTSFSSRHFSTIWTLLLNWEPELGAVLP